MAYVITVREATRGIYAAGSMFLRDKSAADLFENTYHAAVRSYWAAMIVLPLYILGTALEFLIPSEKIQNFGYLASEAGLLNATVAEICIFVLCWFVAWPVFLDRFTGWLDCDKNFFRYIVAYNWMRVTYVVVGVSYVSMHYAGLIPAGSSDVVAIALLLVLWSYHWFVLRHALGVDALFATLLVASEFMFVTLIKGLILQSAL